MTKMEYKRMIGGGGAPSRFVIRELEDQHLTQIATSGKYQFIVLASCVPLRAAQSTAVANRHTALGTKATKDANMWQPVLVQAAPRHTVLVGFCCCGDEAVCEEGKETASTCCTSLWPVDTTSQWAATAVRARLGLAASVP